MKQYSDSLEQRVTLNNCIIDVIQLAFIVNFISFLLTKILFMGSMFVIVFINEYCDVCGHETSLASFRIFPFLVTVGTTLAQQRKGHVHKKIIIYL